MKYCETDAKGERLRLLKKIETATTRAETAESDLADVRAVIERVRDVVASGEFDSVIDAFKTREDVKAEIRALLPEPITEKPATGKDGE